MNAWMLPFAIILIIIGLIVVGPIFVGMKPALDAGVTTAFGNATGNSTFLPYQSFQDSILLNMKWIALIIVSIVAVLGGIAVLWKGATE